MKNYAFLVYSLFSLFLILSSCNKEYWLNNRTQKLIGTWTYDKVLELPSNKPGRNNITGQYPIKSVTFYNNNTVEFFDDNNQIVQSGTWQLFNYQRSQTSSENQVSTLRLEAELMDEKTLNQNTLVLETIQIHHNTLRFEERQNGKILDFKLKRM